MVEKIVLDQADGLRRLMAGNSARRVAVIDGAGAGRFTLNLAQALTQQGQDVLLLDERQGPQSLPLKRDGRLVLMDAVPDGDGALSPLAASSDHILVVFEASAQAITQVYLCIKKLHHAHAFEQLLVLVNEADDAVHANRMLSNLCGAASRYLGLTLRPAGFVRSDPLLEQARRLDLTVVQAFKASPAAQDFCRIAADLLQWPSLPAANASSARLPGRTTRPEPQAASGMQ